MTTDLTSNSLIVYMKLFKTTIPFLATSSLPMKLTPDMSKLPLSKLVMDPSNAAETMSSP